MARCPGRFVDVNRLCERPGCSEPGAVAYGMVPEDLLFWIAPLQQLRSDDPSVLCRRHADAMVVPRGWTLDDRREETLRLFRPRPVDPTPTSTRPRRSRAHVEAAKRPEQLQIDGTGETSRPVGADAPQGASDRAEPAAPWQPDFDADDDLGGLLEVTSPLLARAFRGTGRPKD